MSPAKEGHSMEDDGDLIPTPTPPDKVNVTKAGFISLIEVYSTFGTSSRRKGAINPQ